MKSDLVLPIDNIILNIRVGIIFKYNNKVLVEIPKEKDGNSVIPGGRIKIDELSIEAIKREIKEEMKFELLDNKIKYVKTMEYFFDFKGNRFHEIFFVYQYIVSQEDYRILNSIKDNQDNHNSYYEFIDFSEFDRVNLLPLEIRDTIINN